MGARRLLIQHYVGTPDEIEQRIRRQLLRDSATSLQEVPYVILSTHAPDVWALMTESQYRAEIEHIITLDYKVERFFTARTGAKLKLRVV